MKIEELIAFLDVGEYGTELLDYGWGPTDVDDAITEIAAGHVSIFKYDALRFLSAHPELVDDAIREYGWEACGGTLMGASNMAEYNFIRDELYSHLQATLAMSGAIFIRDSLGMEAIPDELASLIREWASGDVRTMDEIPAKIRGYFQIKEEE